MRSVMKTEITPSCDTCRHAAFCVPRKLGLVDSGHALVAKSTFCGPTGTVIRPNTSSPKMIAIRSGWAAKFLLLADGRRQIIDVLLPGDFATCEEAVFAGTSLPMFALADIEVCVFDRDLFMDAIETQSGAMLEFWQSCAVHIQRLRRLLAAMGQQSAEARIADLIVSIHDRLKVLGLASSEEMPFHLRQIDVAECVGLTQVHVSRMLKSLTTEKLIHIEGSTLRFLDLPKLERLAQT